jgi:hypothetical protein
MTARDDFDLVLRDWFEATAHAAEPAGLHDRVLRRAQRARQRPRWLASPREGFPPTRVAVRVRPAYLGVVGALLAGLALAWSVWPGGIVPSPTPTPTPTPTSSPAPTQTLSPTPSPTLRATPTPKAPTGPVTGRADLFLVPFDYTIPPGTKLHEVSAAPHRDMIAFGNGATRTSDDSAFGYSGQRHGAHERGIVIASGEHATNGLGSATFRTAPADFLADVRDLSGVNLGPVTETVVDGQPALEATTIGPGEVNHFIEVAGPTTAVLGTEADAPYAFVTMPSRLIVFETNGTTVFIQIWASAEDSLEAFMPTASDFVDSLRFDVFQ